jgi:lysozyme
MIAESYGIPLAELMDLNNITDADAIYVGQELLLPPAALQQPTATPLPVHTVRAGETLSEIAQQYKISSTQLMLYNGIRDANAVYEGQRLRSPPVEDETAAETPTTAPTPATRSVTHTPTAPPVSTATKTPTPTSETVDSETVDSEIGDDEENAVGPAAVELARLTNSLNRAYTVRTGDTLAQIALRTGVDFDALRQVNGIAAADVGNLTAGQTLILPATGADLQVRTQERSYEVKPGDSLGSIAAQFTLTLADLLTANRIADPDSITVGQQLMIPGKVLDSDETKATQVGPLRHGFYYYIVQPGDTLSELANAFNSTKLAILEYNGLPDEETVYAGLEIRIPYGPPALPITRPPVPASATSFLVSLSRQQCWLFQGDRVVYSWTCSTGYGEWITRTGTFSVQSKIESAQSSAYRLDMPYWLGIYSVGTYENGIHGLPVEWDTGEKIWERLIGEPATFGCAMLDDRDAVILFNMAYIGMPVHIIH